MKEKVTEDKVTKINDIDAAIFDMDGVITDTASVHAKAWKQMFDEYLQQRPGDYEPMDIESDYLSYIDGKPRYDGVKSFLESRDISLEYGEVNDDPGKETICGLGNRKNQLFDQLIEKDGFEVFREAVTQIDKWKKEGFKTAIISASKNCRKILELAGLNDLFQVRVDGVVSDKLQLKGKPHPDIFLEAAKQLNVAPSKAVVFEDAIAGVQAGERGSFRCVIGVQRNGSTAGLKEHGADVVVENLEGIELIRESKAEKREISKLSSALDHYEALKNQLTAKKLLLFLDYDGTLTPIVKDPAKAILPAGIKDILNKLSAYGTVAMISGRDLDDIKAKVAIPHIHYAGSHGLDISGPEMHKRVGEEALPRLDEAEKAYRQIVEKYEGAQLERKIMVIAVHYRNLAEEKVDQLIKAVKEVVEDDKELKITENKKVIEIKPNIDWDKGKAIDYLIKHLNGDEEAFPIFIGDDVTDEDGFQELFRKGTGVVVGDHGKPSFAKYRLKDEKEVEQFLHQILDILINKSANNWKVVYENYIPEEEPLREALCTLGNGYFATRGAAEESRDEGVHYPGTYLAGGYNRAETEISGKIIENEDLVNWPNWLCLTFRIDKGEWFHIDEVDVLDYQKVLDLKKGVLERKIRFRDNKDRETELVSYRLVSQRNPHLAAIQWQLEPINWSGEVEVRTALDGRVTNNGVERYQDLNGEHLKAERTGKEGENGMYLVATTNWSDITMAQAARTELFLADRPLPAERETYEEEGYIEQVISFTAEKLKPVKVGKIVALYTSKDIALAEPELEARKAITRAGNFEDLAVSHAHAWEELWRRFDIVIDNSMKNQMVLRLHIFHLLQTVSLHTIPLDVGVPSRGWHGEAYRGHIFWDEIFIFPFINLRVPEITRSLLMYRYRRLEEAREYARQHNYKGAMFPWQSGSNGKEESQEIHLNPQSGHWIPDHTFLQRHISADIVYNIMQYYEATEDKEFMNFYGAELILDVANFFSSLASWSEEKKRFEITNVVGPDEYHTQYPHSDQPGINNNAYTNIMASWVLQTAIKIIDTLEEHRQQELMFKLKICEEDIIRWEKVSEQMFVPFINGQVINQFEGYEKLDELDWEHYRKKHGAFLRLDRILQAEDDDVNKYKASKQADALMLFYLFTAEELKEIFERLNYDYTPDIIPETIKYYEKRTSHGSTLSQLVYSWVLARSERKRSWDSFQKALMSDFSDVQGGTTSEGIHLGAMAGTVDLIQRCYSGITISKDTIWIDPQLPENLKQIDLRIRYRGNWLQLRLNHKKVKVHLEKGWGKNVCLGIRGKRIYLEKGEHKTLEL